MKFGYYVIGIDQDRGGVDIQSALCRSRGDARATYRYMQRNSRYSEATKNTFKIIELVPQDITQEVLE